MEKNEDPMKFVARVDKIVGVLGSWAVHLPVEDVNLKIVEVLMTDYDIRTAYDTVQRQHNPC